LCYQGFPAAFQILKKKLSITVSFWETLTFLYKPIHSQLVIESMTNKFKAQMTLVKGHWQQKMIAHQITIKDALKPRFCTAMTVFMPKLTPDYPKPCVFFHLQNRNTTCFLRCANPLELAEKLEHMALTLRSNTWLDIWDRLEKNSEKLIVDNLILDEDYFDMGLFLANYTPTTVIGGQGQP
jgi:hypothetical protein